MSPEEHDTILAYVSHLPHLMAYALMETMPQKFLEYASTGLKDTTRIAGSSSKIWSDICLSNSKNLVKALDELVKNLSSLRKNIVNKEQQNLAHHFTQAKEKRDAL